MNPATDELTASRRRLLGAAVRGLALAALAGGAVLLAWRNGAGPDCEGGGACADCRFREGCDQRTERSRDDG